MVNRSLNRVIARDALLYLAHGLIFHECGLTPKVTSLRPKVSVVVNVPIQKCVRIPTVVDKHRTREVLENSLKMMPRLGVTTQPIVSIEWCEEGATSALLAIFIAFKQSRIIRPVRNV